MAINNYKHNLDEPLIVKDLQITGTRIDNLNTLQFTKSIQLSVDNTSGGGLIIGDDGDIVDLNDGYASHRFSSGIRIYSTNRGGSSVIQLSNAGQIQSTGAFNAATGTGQIYLNGTTGNRIDFNNNGVNPPAFSTRSVGTKIVLNSSISASAGDYAFGMANATLWASVPQAVAGQQHRWYAGITTVAELKGTGEFILGGGNLVTGTASQKLQVTGGAYISGNLGIGFTNPTSPLEVSGNSYISGNVGVGTTNFTGKRLAIGANTNTDSQIGLSTGGALKTVIEAGSIEHDSNFLWHTPNTTFGRGTIPTTIFTSDLGTALTAGTESTAQSLFGTNNDTITLLVGTYYFQSVISIQRGSVSTTSASLRFNFSGGGTGSASMSFQSTSSVTVSSTPSETFGSSNTLFFNGVISNTDNVVSSACTFAGGNYNVFMCGIIKVTSAGTFTPKYSLSTNITGSTATQTKAGNYLILQPLNTSSVSFFTGGWN